MEQELFSEKESLELISKMLRQTRHNIASTSSGGDFLLYGWATTLLSVLIYFLVASTDNGYWGLLYSGLLLIAIFQGIRKSLHKPEMVTYMDKSIDSVWVVLGTMFGLTYLFIIFLSFFYDLSGLSFALMMPLSLLYAGIGTSITGIITRFKPLIYTPLPAFLIGIYMLVGFVEDWQLHAWWYLLFGAAFLLMMVIPGHLMNIKAKGEK